ncbi:MAG: hypothetical protein LBG75_00300 [Candidatus Nomurabacteria bacterium]|nr:hypothetical protein [Candidatus Nomurabacteria bacterium]
MAEATTTSDTGAELARRTTYYVMTYMTSWAIYWQAYGLQKLRLKIF